MSSTECQTDLKAWKALRELDFDDFGAEEVAEVASAKTSESSEGPLVLTSAAMFGDAWWKQRYEAWVKMRPTVAEHAPRLLAFLATLQATDDETPEHRAPGCRPKGVPPEGDCDAYLATEFGQ